MRLTRYAVTIRDGVGERIIYVKGTSQSKVRIAVEAKGFEILLVRPV